MLELDFGPNSGGLRTFQNTTEIAQYLDSRRDEWRAYFASLPTPVARNSGIVNLTTRPWSELSSGVRNAETQHPNAPQRVLQIVKGESLRKAIAKDSKLGKAILSIFDDHGEAIALGAIKYHQATDGEQIFNTLTKAETFGAISLLQHLAGLSSKSIKIARDASRKALQELENDVSQHRANLVLKEEDHTRKLSELQTSLEGQKAEYESFRQNTILQFSLETDSRKESWDDIFNLYTERLRLESPVKLWNDQSTHHRSQARKWFRRSISTAVVGLILGGVFALASLNFAEWLFSDVLNQASGNDGDALLRPTWQFEVIFSAAATLLYLTIYLWMMRIIVRLYMTEEHLAIDAKSRASMAETYLALTKDHAATDQDRAIVLASLFRPIADGIVSDDGLPAITPAAILSGWAGGKS